MPGINKPWTPDERLNGFDNYKPGRNLIESGDLNLDGVRDDVNKYLGRATTLTPSQLLVLEMSNEDDDEEWRNERIKSAEQFFMTAEGKEQLNNCIAAFGLEPLEGDNGISSETDGVETSGEQTAETA